MVKFWVLAKIRFFGVWRKSSFGRLVKVIFRHVANAECSAFGESKVLNVWRRTRFWAFGEGQSFGRLAIGRWSSLGIWKRSSVGRLAKVKFRHLVKE